MSSSFLSTRPMLSSSCFMPTSWIPQSFPPSAPSIALILGGEHGRDVHTRWVVPDEERLAGLRGIIAVEEVDDLGRDFLIHGLRAFQRQRAFIVAHLVLSSAIRGVA